MQFPAASGTAPDFHAIFSATASPYLILDPVLVIVEVNEAYLRSTRRHRKDLLGKYVFDAFPDNPDDPQANGVRNLHSSLQRVLHTRAVDRMAVQKYDIPTGDPQAGKFEERYWSPVNTPVFDRQGRLTHIIHHVEDVTARVASDTALRDSERRFRALTNATADVIYRMSPDWSHMHELDGRGFLKDTAALGPYRIEEYVYPPDLDLVRTSIAEAIRDKIVFALEHRVLRAGGGHGWTYSRAVPILDAAGEIQEWIGSASDITDRKLAEEGLKDANRRKDEFLAMLAHELRNPLAPISAAAQLLHLGGLDEARLLRASQVIQRQVVHMTNLVDDLLDVSRVTRGLVKLDALPLEIGQVVTDAVEQVTPLIQSRRHHLDLQLHPGMAIVSGDRKRLVQTVANLLNNAAKFTPEGGRLRLRTSVRDAHIHIEVSDNGIGMTPDTVRHAFDLFSQAERSSDRAFGGLGLGLSLVKSLVELHGGSVSCASEGLGKGSRFTVRLPSLDIDAPHTGIPGAWEPLPGAAAGLRIMVVDDNVDAATTLAMVLDAMGHQVLVEHAPEAALERARSVAPQVCLLDIGLPGMDGNALAQRLRAQAETAAAVLVAVTGYGQERDRKQSSGAGFDHHLVKPVDMDALGAILSGIGTARA